MCSLTKEEMFQVSGGAAITYSWINAITKAVTLVYQVGQAIGSTLRRVTSRNYC